jgi:AcrR family transcriptional regulator
MQGSTCNWFCTTPRDPERTRGRLLRAAFQEMHRSGFRNADLDAILARAGVTKGALYYHFDNKEALGYALRLGLFLTANIPTSMHVTIAMVETNVLPASRIADPVSNSGLPNLTASPAISTDIRIN